MIELKCKNRTYWCSEVDKEKVVFFKSLMDMAEREYEYNKLPLYKKVMQKVGDFVYRYGFGVVFIFLLLFLLTQLFGLAAFTILLKPYSHAPASIL